jgi:hypothetical protein
MVRLLLGSAEGNRLSGPGGARGDAVNTGEGNQSVQANPPAKGEARPQQGARPAGGGIIFATMFWGKDSRIYMEEVVTWLLRP